MWMYHIANTANAFEDIQNIVTLSSSNYRKMHLQRSSCRVDIYVLQEGNLPPEILK